MKKQERRKDGRERQEMENGPALPRSHPPTLSPFRPALPPHLITILCLCGVFHLPSWSFAQDLDHTIEAVVDIEEGSIDSEDLPLLEALRQAPLDINKADRIAWEQLPWITAELAQALVDWRRIQGPFLNRRMLIRVPEMNEAILDHLMPFITTGIHNSRTQGKWRMTNSRLDRDGVQGPGRLGIQSDVDIRGRFIGGMRFERRVPNRTYRWQAGYAEVHDTGLIDRLLLGHFEMDFGQGLVWSSQSARPSLSTFSASVKRRSRGLRPARTTYSSKRLHGMAGYHDGRRLKFIWALSRDKTGLWKNGGRLTWLHNRGWMGTSFAVRGKTYFAGFDMDILFGPTNVFGEIAFADGKYTGVQTGLIWRMGPIEGGLALHREPIRYYVDDKDAAKNWSSLLLRWKPDPRTVVQLSVEPQKQAHQLLLKRVARLRHRWRRAITLTGTWREEKETQGAVAGWLQSRWQGQVEWRVRRQIQWRGRLERRRRVAEGTDYQLLMSTRYQSKEQVNLWVQWQYTLSDPIKGLPDASTSARSYRSRWTLLMQGPVTPGIDILMRYAQTRQTRHVALKTLLKESEWSMQVSMAW